MYCYQQQPRGGELYCRLPGAGLEPSHPSGHRIFLPLQFSLLLN